MYDLLFFCLDLDALLMLNKWYIYLFGWNQTSKTGGQLYGDIFPYKVSEYYLLQPILWTFDKKFILELQYFSGMSKIWLQVQNAFLFKWEIES